MRAKLDGQALSEQKVIFSAAPVEPAQQQHRRHGCCSIRLATCSSPSATYNCSSPTDEPDKQRAGLHPTVQDQPGPAVEQRRWARSSTHRPPTACRPRATPSPTTRTPGRKSIPTVSAAWKRSPSVEIRRPVVGGIRPRGSDEVHVIKPGKNYGWPVITYGTDYTGAKVWATSPSMKTWNSRSIAWDRRPRRPV